jgi:catechol 2,3-dioxygenase-like lactoylglutathione lyase family enzyme
MEKEKSLLQGIDTIIIRVSNILQSKQWYIDNLGLKQVWFEEKMKLAVLDTGSPTSITLWETGKAIVANSDTASFPIFKTEDVSYTREQLIKKGVKTSEVIADDYVQYIFFHDPDGNVLEACQVHE